MTSTLSARGVAGAVVTAAVLLCLTTTAWPQEEEEEPSFTVSEILIQLNDTDEDLGFHARIDGDPWETVQILNPHDRILFSVRNRRDLKTQGLTEFAFESAEPNFEDLDPEEFFERFPEGEYEIVGKSVDGDKMESEDLFTHVIPAAPNITFPLPAECEEATPVAAGPVTLLWDAVTTSHPELGREDPNIEITHTIVSIEREEPEPVLKLDVSLPPNATSFAIPDDYLALGTLFKFQVLVAEASGNETSSEGCFEIQE